MKLLKPLLNTRQSIRTLRHLGLVIGPPLHVSIFIAPSVIPSSCHVVPALYFLI